jgi:CheY-like chemotaxis protein
MPEVRILHLDTDPSFAETAQTRLRSQNPDFAVTWVRNRSGFRAALALGGFDIILSEFGLTEYPGQSILEDARKACSGTPFLFLISADKVEAAAESVLAGAEGYILKSDLEGVLRTLARILPSSSGTAGKPAQAPDPSQGLHLADLDQQIRIPLNGVMSTAGLLAETVLDEKQLRYVRIIQTSSQSVLRILNDIRESSGIEEEKAAMEGRPIEPPETSAEPLPDASRKQYPLRILVAEDNEIGQMVICSLLENLGQRAKVVTHGKAAVEAYRKSTYDLIFMDCHMPEMNGYEAVARIRDLERENGKRRALIFAMTADVLSGTREKCVEAGMDGYLSKPILLESLEDIIGKARAGAWQDALGTGDSSGSQDALVAGDIDLRILDRLRLLSAGDVPGMFQELVSGYIEQSEAKLEDLYGHVEAGDSAQVAGVAHGLKGLSLNFGALAMARECDTLQRLCEAGAEKCRPILRGLRETKMRTNSALSNLAGLPVPETGPGIAQPRS